MRRGRSRVRGLVFGLFGLGFALSACSGDAGDCHETRTCPVPVGYIDAGDFDDWWTAGAPGESATPFDAGGPSTGAAAGEGGAHGTDGAPGTEPPRVLEISPADGAMGVASDARIVLTFNQPANPASFEAAYESADLPRAALLFTWNETHTVLTMKPTSPLSYQSGPAEPDGGASFLPKTYHYGFNDVAWDDAGHVLSAVHLAFSTLRQVSAELPADALRTGNWTDGEGEGIHNCLRGAKAPYAPSVCVGDDANNVRYTGFISFDLNRLPAGIVQFSSARLLGDAVAYGATEALGASRLEHVAFGDLSEAALAMPASANLGPFYGGAGLATGAHFELAEDVTSAVAADYANSTASSNRTQYRLGFAQIAADAAWDDVELRASTIALATTYLLP